MLHHPTLHKLQTLKLTGMVKALSEQMDLPASTACEGCCATRRWS